MTIFEMLEKLETEVISLRTRCELLTGSLDHASSNGNRKRPSTKRKASTPKKKKVAQKAAASAKNKPRQAVSEQLELPVSEQPASAEQGGRPVGKRQALGRSLVQLRKMSAWRQHHSPEE